MKTVMCFNCKKEVYQLTEEVFAGDAITSAPFKGIHGFEDPQDGEVIACPNCGDKSGMRLGLEAATGHEVMP